MLQPICMKIPYHLVNVRRHTEGAREAASSLPCMLPLRAASEGPRSKDIALRGVVDPGTPEQKQVTLTDIFENCQMLLYVSRASYRREEIGSPCMPKAAFAAV